MSGLTKFEMFKLFWRVGGWLFCICLCLSTLAFWIGSVVRSDAERFAADGITTVATILELEERRRTHNFSRLQHLATFSYVVRDNPQPFVLKRIVSRPFYQDVKVGDQVTIRYLTSDPKEIEYLDHQYQEGSAALTTAFVLFSSLMCLSGWWVFSLMGDALSALRRDETYNAKIARIQKRWSFLDRQYRYQLHWHMDDTVHKSLWRDFIDTHRLNVDSEITVLRGKKRNWWMGDLLDRPPKKGIMQK